MQFRAVIFDLGGVVFPSPFAVFRAYEDAHGLPHRFISDVIVHGGDHGAWSRFERGEFGVDDFAVAFEAECEAAGGTVVIADLFAGMTGGEGGAVPGWSPRSPRSGERHPHRRADQQLDRRRRRHARERRHAHGQRAGGPVRHDRRVRGASGCASPTPGSTSSCASGSA